MWHYFTDPVLAGPTLGCMLVCIVAAVVGVLVVLRRESLVGEALSHASYPGVIVALWLGGWPLLGAAVSCSAGLWVMHMMERRWKVAADSALAWVLSVFFGVGIVILSGLQRGRPGLYRELEGYLFGQAATMVLSDVWVVGVVAFGAVAIVALMERAFQVAVFDKQFGRLMGVKGGVDTVLLALVVVSVVVGVRAVGVVLLTAMLVLPAVTARLFVGRLRWLLVGAGVLGAVAGVGGVMAAHEFSSSGVSYPTGPMIVGVAVLLLIAALVAAPRKGLLWRSWRRGQFSLQCAQENVLKALWKTPTHLSLAELRRQIGVSRWWLMLALWRLRRKGHLQGDRLTPQGMLWARRVVRLHRLWELYLVEFCKVAATRVHPSAEEMEHILTPDIERELVLLLRDPERDPHAQPIPAGEQL